MSFSFWANVGICVASLLSTWLNHADLLEEIREETDAKTKKRKTWGLRLVWFVTIISVVALPFTAWESVSSEDRVAKLETNAAVNDLRNRPIADLSAFVSFRVKGPDRPDMERWGTVWGDDFGKSNVVAIMWLSKNGFQGTTTFSIVANNFDCSGAELREYSMHFKGEQHAALQARFGGETQVKEISRINTLWIFIKFLPKDCEVLSGTAVVTVNGNLRKVFQILPTKTDSNPMGLLPPYPYVLIGTNASSPSDQ